MPRDELGGERALAGLLLTTVADVRPASTGFPPLSEIRWHGYGVSQSLWRVASPTSGRRHDGFPGSEGCGRPAWLADWSEDVAKPAHDAVTLNNRPPPRCSRRPRRCRRISAWPGFTDASLSHVPRSPSHRVQPSASRSELVRPPLVPRGVPGGGRARDGPPQEDVLRSGDAPPLRRRQRDRPPMGVHPRPRPHGRGLHDQTSEAHLDRSADRSSRRT